MVFLNDQVSRGGWMEEEMTMTVECRDRRDGRTSFTFLDASYHLQNSGEFSKQPFPFSKRGIILWYFYPHGFQKVIQLVFTFQFHFILSLPSSRPHDLAFSSKWRSRTESNLPQDLINKAPSQQPHIYTTESSCPPYCSLNQHTFCFNIVYWYWRDTLRHHRRTL